MTKQIRIAEKWIDVQKAAFTEYVDDDGKKQYILSATIVPFGEISRNGVMYNKESVENTHKDLIGKPVMFNHVTQGAKVYPRGEWTETWIEKDGMHGTAKIYDTKYNEDLIEYLKAATEPKVSLQITGGATQKKNESTGKYYKEANVEDWIEASIVNTPGFMNAKASFAVAMSEAFSNDDEDGVDSEEPSEEESFYSQLNSIRENLKEDDVEKGLFPNDEFQKGMDVEKKEHPDLSPLLIAQLVLDHLKEDEYYYSNKEPKEEANKNNIIDKIDKIDQKNRQASKVIDTTLGKYGFKTLDQLPEDDLNQLYMDIKKYESIETEDIKVGDRVVTTNKSPTGQGYKGKVVELGDHSIYVIFDKLKNDGKHELKPDEIKKETVETEAIKVGDKVHSPSGYGKVISIKGNKVIVRSNDPAGDFEYDMKQISKENS